MHEQKTVKGMNVFVVGVDGVIGGALFAHLKRKEVTVTGSSRHEQHSSDVISFDLADAQTVALPAVTAAVICAGVTSLAACRASPEETRAINVDHTLTLAKRLAAQGAFVIALSTNLVFDGSRPLLAATEAPAPQTEYGRQKCDLERGVLALGDRGAVVRLTKVVSADTLLFRAWRNALANGEVIMPFSDMVMSPIPLIRVVEALAMLIAKSKPGIYQLSATEDIGYADAARIIADVVKVSDALLRPQPAPTSIPPIERPHHTCLDTAEAQMVMGWRAISAKEALAEVLSP